MRGSAAKKKRAVAQKIRDVKHQCHFLVLLCVIGLVGCASPTLKPRKSLASSALVSQDEEIRSGAGRDAAKVIESGKLYVCETGTIAIYLPGIPEAHLNRVRTLPRRTLRNGCLAPGVARAIAYAAVFNAEILRHLLTQ